MPYRDPDIPDLITTTEAGELFGVSKQVVSQWHTRDLFAPSAPVGRSTLFLRWKVELLFALVADVRDHGGQYVDDIFGRYPSVDGEQRVYLRRSADWLASLGLLR